MDDKPQNDPTTAPSLENAPQGEQCAACARKDEEIGQLKARIDEMHDRVSRQNRAVDRLNHEAARFDTKAPSRRD